MNLLNPIPLPYRILTMAALVAACSGLAYTHGLEVEQGRQARSQMAQDEAAEKIRTQVRQRVAAAAKGSAENDQKVRIIYRTIMKEVVRYAQSPDGADRVLDDQWVCLYNRSARPEAGTSGCEAAGDATRSSPDAGPADTR